MFVHHRIIWLAILMIPLHWMTKAQYHFPFFLREQTVDRQSSVPGAGWLTTLFAGCCCCLLCQIVYYKPNCPWVIEAKKVKRDLYRRVHKSPLANHIGSKSANISAICNYLTEAEGHIICNVSNVTIGFQCPANGATSVNVYICFVALWTEISDFVILEGGQFSRFQDDKLVAWNIKKRWWKRSLDLWIMST